MRNYKNYHLKNQILKVLKDNNLTVKSIFTAIQYQGTKDELFSEMYALTKFGYVKRHKVNKLYQYQLTQKGIRHANNPYHSYVIKHNRIDNKIKTDIKKGVDETLLKDDKFREALHRLANDMVQRPVVVNQPPSSPSIEDRIDKPLINANSGLDKPDNHLEFRLYPDNADQKAIDKIEKGQNNGQWKEAIKDLINGYENKIIELGNKLTQSTQQSTQPNIPSNKGGVVIQAMPQYYDKDGTPITFEQHVAKQQKRIQKEQVATTQHDYKVRLVREYLQKNWLLGVNFFNGFGTMYPWLLKGKGILYPNSIEIISNSNPEIDRNHAKRRLTEEEINKAQFRIYNYDNNGIWVIGIGMKKPYYMRF